MDDPDFNILVKNSVGVGGMVKCSEAEMVVDENGNRNDAYVECRLTEDVKDAEEYVGPSYDVQWKYLNDDGDFVEVPTDCGKNNVGSF